MALTNAEKQKRWRDKRNALAYAMTGTFGQPNEIADGILRELGGDKTRKVVAILKKRLRNLKADCPACHGTGFLHFKMETECGMSTPLIATEPCDCGSRAKAALADSARRAKRQLKNRT
jgi:hypothetical protein